MEFSPKTPIIWDEHSELMAVDHDKEDLLVNEWEDGDTPETNIDGLMEYAYGFWFRYLTTYPTRMYQKPAWLQLARFATNKEVEDAKSVGDRTLAIFIAKGYYHFTTYSLNGNKLSVGADVNYGDQLEGVWSFLYFGFS